VNTKLQWSNGRLNSAINFTKPKKSNKYFLGFLIFETKAERIANKAKYFWIFK
jgi:hypothetical protein